MLDIKEILGLKKKKGKSKKTKVTKFHVLVAGALGLIVIFLFVQMVQFVEMRHELKFIDLLEANNAQVIQEMSQAKDFLTSFGGDLNQIREYLLLPTTDYDFGDLGEVDEEATEEDDLTTLVFTFIDRLGEYEEKKELYAANLAGITEFFADPAWGENFLFVEGFTVYDDQLEGMDVLDLALDLDGTFTVGVYTGEMEFVDDEDLEEVKLELQAFIDGIEEHRNLIRDVNENRTFISATALLDVDVQSLMVEKGMSVSDEQEDVDAYYYEFKNSDGTVVSEIRIYKNGTMTVDGIEALKEILGAVDARTALEKLVDENQAELQEVMLDEAFAAALEQAGFSVGEVIDTEERISYPILDGDGVVVRVLYLDKVSGEVRVEMPEDGSSETLSAAIEGLDISSSKKKLWICQTHCLSMVI